MKIKMESIAGAVVIDTDEVTNFYAKTEHGLTAIETKSMEGNRALILVKHSFLQVTQALSNAWSIDQGKSEGGAS